MILKDLKPSNIRVDAATGLAHGFWNSLTSSRVNGSPPGPGVHRRNSSLRGVGTDRRNISWKRATSLSHLTQRRKRCRSWSRFVLSSQLYARWNCARTQRRSVFRLDVRDSPRDEYRRDSTLHNPFKFMRYCDAASRHSACFCKERNRSHPCGMIASRSAARMRPSYSGKT